MGKIFKEPRRAMKRRWMSVREGVAVRSPTWVRRAVGPMIDYADLLFVDHGVFRMFYSNRHAIGGQAWRSAQPAPHHIRRMAALGVKTIVNLRGDRETGAYRLQQAACQKHGIRLEDVTLKSRAAPTREQVYAVKNVLEAAEYPILLHCKSGADRAGLASVLYLHFREGKSIREAMSQLDLRYGHIKQADTGIIDFFFERYLEAEAKTGIEFLTWVDTVYDPDELTRDFKARGWANALVNKVLRRE